MIVRSASIDSRDSAFEAISIVAFADAGHHGATAELTLHRRSTSDAPKDQEHLPQRPVRRETFRFEMLSKLKPASVCASLPTLMDMPRPLGEVSVSDAVCVT